LFPYSVTRWAIRRLNEVERQPAIVYLHPWEIDADQPRLPVGRVSHLRHAVNTQTTETKLRRLLREVEFAPVREILRESGVLIGKGVA
jgi:hypothetical protein